MRVNQSQEFLIAGYTVGARNFDAVVFGYYDGSRLIYALGAPAADSRQRPATNSSSDSRPWPQRIARSPTCRSRGVDDGARG